MRLGTLAPAAVWLAALLIARAPDASQRLQKANAGAVFTEFQTAKDCLACHNGLTTPSGEDVSIGSAWRSSMMANSSRDPYWQASVRREVIDHPSARTAIEDECSVCHMPMSRTMAAAAGRKGEIFSHLPIAGASGPDDRLAADGVSCSLCHRIAPDGLGAADSFTGGYVVGTDSTPRGPSIFGPFAVDAGRTAVMQSVTGAVPAEGTHVRQSELCATCHTLYTRALDATGATVGSLPEQVPFLEWRHSAFRGERSCQSCHMPVVSEPTRVSSVLGKPREDFSRHSFIGGNFFMLRLLNRYRHELGVEALPAELELSARKTLAQLASETAAVSLTAARRDDLLTVTIDVKNLTGHKLPTGYPSRRAWLHVAVRDGAGRVAFESGAVAASGAIQGNDNDDDPARFEPHYEEISRPDEVQIYESIMVDASGAPTTGLLSGLRFAKDNRLLPRGFDKTSADADIAVLGSAAADSDFTSEGDRVSYLVTVSGTGPWRVDVELRYQPVSFRWAENLRRYDAPEPKRFVAYYESMSGQSSALLARSSVTVN